MKKYKLKQSYLKSSQPTLGNDLEKEEWITQISMFKNNDK